MAQQAHRSDPRTSVNSGTHSGPNHHGTAHEHFEEDQAHGTYRSYITGFVLSVILTAIPFAIVMSGGFDSRMWTVLTVIAFAVVQVVVHMIYFLHMNTRSDEGWTAMSMMFTIIVVVIMMVGSLWVMYHLNTNMMPEMNMPTGIGS
ncbi:MAG: cytochrome o ubiquinol oxidase subunit IV [Paracoccus denitrificans]|nr:MAG: cytochrome o ubiquinol oxidase subunit IV [Paracoccus denitrificans]PZO84425.1 MAG: cytochrome o ubiquinol oxidase subunit IV [Paracoccus denitrificans]